jgi:MFS family permease
MANLSDRHGRRPIYLLSVALFALGSLVIALSPRFWMVLVGRAIQGIGAGGIIPTASAVVGDVFTGEKRGKMLGLIGATYGMAFVLGPPLASGLILLASWHWIFLINLPIAATILYLGLRALPAARSMAQPLPLDLAGIAVTFSLLSALVLAVTRVIDPLLEPVLGFALWPWLLLAVLLLLVLLVAVERRAAAPLIPLGLFAKRQLATTYVLAAGGGFGMGSVIFLTSIATHAYGVTPQHAGFVLLPLVLCSMVGSMASGRRLGRTGPRSQILLGFAMLSLGYGLSAVTGFGLWLFLLASMPAGLGIGILVGGALRSIAIDEAPLAVRTSAQGLINICTAIGTLTAAASISAMADLQGGGSAGFSRAYVMVALLMLAMLAMALGLRKQAALTQQTA